MNNYKLARRANHTNFGKSVKPSHQKYFALPETQITLIVHPVPHPQEGRIAIVTDVGRGMRWPRFRAAYERASSRTAKSCGSDAPMLASNRRRLLLQSWPVTVTTKPVTGESTK